MSSSPKKAARRAVVPRARAESMQETREALVAAGLAEFAERGLDTPSLDAICARAGYTRGAFYVHFRDRDDFLEAVMTSVIGQLLDAVIVSRESANDVAQTIERFAALVRAATAPQAHAAGALAVNLHRVADACARSPLLRERFVSLVGGAADRIATTIVGGQRAGSVRADLDTAALSRVLVLLALGIIAAVDIGVPLEVEATQSVVLRLLAPLPSQRGKARSA